MMGWFHTTIGQPIGFFGNIYLAFEQKALFIQTTDKKYIFLHNKNG
jgi:hypothetical protein